MMPRPCVSSSAEGKSERAGRGKDSRDRRSAKGKGDNAKDPPDAAPPELEENTSVLAAGGSEVFDDFYSSWEACKADGTKWGGRGQGGRGVSRQQAGMSSAVKDVYVEKITLAVGGQELLRETPLRLMHGRCYALLGDNGVGKSSLLYRLSRNQVPGVPPHLVMALVAQEEARAPPTNKSALEWLVALATNSVAAALQREMEALEAALEELDLDGGSAAVATQAHEWAGRIGEIAEEQEELRGHRLRDESEKLLTQMGMSKEQQQSPAAFLSGGQRMRIRVAQAVLCKPDVLLLDEPTNHLDLQAVLWLQAYLLRGRARDDTAGSCGGSGSGGGGGGGAILKRPATVVMVSHASQLLV